MRVLILNWRDIKNPKSGGAEIVTLEHAKYWVKRGHNVTIFTPFKNSSLLAPLKLEVNQVTLWPLFTQYLACSRVTISAPPDFGFLISLQFRISTLIVRCIEKLSIN